VASRTLRALCLCFLIALALPAAAALAQQDYPPDAGGLSLGSTVIAPGETLLVEGHGFCPGRPVELTLEGPGVRRHLASPVADPSGSFSVRVRIPADTEPGSYTIVASGLSPDCRTPKVLSASIVVSAAGAGVAPAATGGGGGALPFTGLQLGLMVVAALALIGGGLLVRHRTRLRH